MQRIPLVQNAAAQGFTAPPDQGYVNLLRNNGHTVTRFVSSSPTANPAPAFASQLNNFDLIISSRQVNSGDYGDPNDAVGAAERAYWHGLTKPMIMMSGYILRDNRLQFYTASTIPDISNQGPVTLAATQPSHPIFQGITLDGSNNMQYATYPISTPSGLVQRGLSINTDPIAGGGTVLATSATAGGGSGGTLIGYWQPGCAVGDSHFGWEENGVHER